PIIHVVQPVRDVAQAIGLRRATHVPTGAVVQDLALTLDQRANDARTPKPLRRRNLWRQSTGVSRTARGDSDSWRSSTPPARLRAVGQSRRRVFLVDFETKSVLISPRFQDEGVQSRISKSLGRVGSSIG